MITSNGVGAGHLIRTSAIAQQVNRYARPVILSMAYSVVEVANALGFECEFIPGRDKKLMPNRYWDKYLCDRILALIDELGAKVVTFDGVVPYPGFLSAKLKRPEVTFIWIRRGMWQKQPHGVALGFQSRLVDLVIEPGDVAREYDFGPTRNRKEARLTSPVSLYKPENAMKRDDARAFLGLPRDGSVVLIQMGVGAKDLDERVSAILRGLSSWAGVQIVMPNEPKDREGTSLVPDGVSVTIIRHFPLAEVIHAFDGIICAAGYNSVHEVIPARIPSLLIANNRGTDDQFARARWCGDKELTLYASTHSLQDIEEKSAMLADATLRQKLTRNCAAMTHFNGANQIASIIHDQLFTNEESQSRNVMSLRNRFDKIFQRGIAYTVRRSMYTLLWWASLVYRRLFPHKYQAGDQGDIKISRSLKVDFLEPFIRGPHRLEHILASSSKSYEAKRQSIAKHAFRLSKNIGIVDID